MAWNYKEVSVPKLTEDFKQLYVVSLKGKEAMLYNGLLLLGYEKGIKSLKTDIVQYPSKDNEWTAIVKATLIGYGWNPIENKVIEVEFSCIGDANAKNCTSMVAQAYIRMADTRAKARALRDYTGIGMVALDELGGSVSEESMINATQINKISALVKVLALSKEDSKKQFVNVIGKDDLRKATEEEANQFIAHLNKLKKQGEEKSKANAAVNIDDEEAF